MASLHEILLRVSSQSDDAERDLTQLAASLNALDRAEADAEVEVHTAEARAELEALNPQGRLVRPDEVAAMVAYLCSPAAASVHGQALAIDGGETTL